MTVLLEERLLLSLVQWAGEGLASTDKTASSEGKEAFEMLTRRCGSGCGCLWVRCWVGLPVGVVVGVAACGCDVGWAACECDVGWAACGCVGGWGCLWV